MNLKPFPRIRQFKIWYLILFTMFFVFTFNGFSLANDNESLYKGNIRVIEGIPFLKLYGTYYEMGIQYGNLLKEPLLEVQEKIFPYKTNVSTGEFYQHLKYNMPVKYQDFLKGVSKSAGISYENLLIGSFYEFTNAGCSSVLVKMDSDGSSYLMHAKNRDANNGKNQIIIEFNPEKGYKYLITATIGALFIHEGINEKGISVTGNAAPKSNYKVKKWPQDDIYQMILESAHSLDEVDKIINKYKSDYAEILTVGSSYENNGTIYDLDNIKRVKHEMKDKKYLFVTNKFLSDDLTPQETRFNDPRYRAIKDFLENHSQNSVDDMIDLLATRPINNISTIHSIIFDGKKKDIYFAFSERYAAEAKWLKYNWINDEIALFK